MIFDEMIIPYKGTNSFLLYQALDVIRAMLTEAGVAFREEIWESESETVPNPWTVIIIDDVISFFFAKNHKLFKIVFWGGYKGTLPNGVATGIPLEKAKELDETLSYDEWEEDYQSDSGYWMEDDLETGTVMSLSIYIKELLDDNTFDLCDW